MTNIPGATKAAEHTSDQRSERQMTRPAMGGSWVMAIILGVDGAVTLERPGRRGRRRSGARSLYSRDVNSEFNWWLLIVGLVVGAGLVWLVVADSRRREVDEGDAEREGEAHWIAQVLSDAGRPADDDEVLE